MYDLNKEFFIITQFGITHIYSIRMSRNAKHPFKYILLLSPFNNPVKIDEQYLHMDYHREFLLRLKDMKI